MAMVLGNNQDHYGKQKAILFTFYFIPKNCRNNQRVMMHDWRTNEPTSGNNFMKPKAELNYPKVQCFNCQHNASITS